MQQHDPSPADHLQTFLNVLAVMINKVTEVLVIESELMPLHGLASVCYFITDAVFSAILTSVFGHQGRNIKDL